MKTIIGLSWGDENIQNLVRKLKELGLAENSISVLTHYSAVRELLGADTETEAVDQALSALLLREELIAGVRRVAGSGGVENVFDGDVEP